MESETRNYKWCCFLNEEENKQMELALKSDGLTKSQFVKEALEFKRLFGWDGR